MTVLTTSRVAADRGAPLPASPASASAPISGLAGTKLPITIVPPRGGVFQTTRRRVAGGADTARPTRDTVLSALWPLINVSSAPAPTPDAIAMAEAAVARIRAEIANAVVRFRARVGIASRDADGAERMAMENWALTLKVDEAGLLDRMVGELMPSELAAAAVPGRHPATSTVERVVASRVELHLCGLVGLERLLTETARARLLFSLSETCG